MQKLLLVAVLALLSFPAHALDYKIKTMTLNSIVAIQPDNDSFSGQVNWTPYLVFTDFFKARLNGGFSALLGSNKKRFVMFDYQLLAHWDFLPNWGFELGGGGQTWLNNGGTRPVASSFLVLGTSKKIFGYIDRFFGGYTHRIPLKSKEVHTSEIIAGLGADF